MPDKDQIARRLAETHREMDPGICRIVRLLTDREADAGEPLKLLEVNPATSPSGIWPIAFGADPPEVPFPSVVVEVTEAEFEAIGRGVLPLPEGWRLGDTLYQTAA